MYHNKILAYNLQLLKDMGLPDYSQMYHIQFAAGETYTVPCDSLLVGSYYGAVRSSSATGHILAYGFLVINDFVFSKISNKGVYGGDNTTSGLHMPIIVKQGDVLGIHIDGGGYTDRFSADFTAIPLV